MTLAAKSPPEPAASMNIGVTATTFVLTEPGAPAAGAVAAPAKGAPAKK